MITPVDGVTVFHNAFRLDMKIIDDASLALARGTSDDTTGLERFRFLNEILVWHADGEELAIFPALEKVAPSVAEAYAADHRGLDAAYEALSQAVAVGDRLAIARATAAFKFHLDLHLAKEDAHLYRLFGERLQIPEQAEAMGLMSSTVPQDRFPEVIRWLFGLVDQDDQATMMRIWHMAMPAELFAGITPLVKQSVGDGWAGLTGLVSDLDL
jgi:hypothetical protein